MSNIKETVQDAFSGSEGRKFSIAITSCEYHLGNRLAHHILQSDRDKFEKIRCCASDLKYLEELKRMGAECFQVDNNRQETFEKAFEGCKAVLLIIPPESHALQACEVICKAIKSKGACALLMSNVGAAEARGSLEDFRKCEETLKRNVDKHTIFRLDFITSLYYAWAPMIQEKSEFATPVRRDKRYNPVDIEDVACAVTRVLSHHEMPRGATQMYTCTGPQPVSNDDIVRSLNEAIGEKDRIKWRECSKEEMKKYLLSLREREQKSFIGMTEKAVMWILDYFDAVNEGKQDFTSGDLQKIIGKEPRKVSRFFERHSDMFKPHHIMN